MDTLTPNERRAMELFRQSAIRRGEEWRRWGGPGVNRKYYRRMARMEAARRQRTAEELDKARAHEALQLWEAEPSGREHSIAQIAARLASHDKLVEGLKRLTEAVWRDDSFDMTTAHNEARALLKELGQ